MSVALARASVRPAPGGSTQRGFTLVETIMVVVIVGILASIAAPSFTELMRNTRLSSASSALQVSLSVARSEAIKRGSDARVTVAANGSAGNWTNGWTVFADKTANANGSVAPTADSATVTRIEVVAAPSSPLSVGPVGLNYFIYNGQGRMIDAAGAVVAAQQIWFFDATSEKYCLVIANTGRVRVARAGSAAACPTD